jgi:L-threonylcarbamoyladenylate synthase
MQILKLNKTPKEEIYKQAIDVLNSGGMVVFPTETAYGMAVDATNDEAVKKLKQYKGMRGSKPISIAVCDKEMANEYAQINNLAENLYDNYLPGPITVVSLSTGKASKEVESINGTVGIRFPDYPFILELIEAFGKPITATSANVSYKPVPYDIQKLIKQTPKKSAQMIDLVLDAGILPKRTTSTVLDTTMNTLEVLRDGAVKFDDAISKSKLIEERECKTPDETIAFGKEIAEKYIDDNSVVFALSGELGAGKTQFSKGVGEYLGVEEIVNSPTYTIINEYEYKDKVLAHMDTWRVTDTNEFNRSGLEEHLQKGNIIVIEWADKFFDNIVKLGKEYNAKVIKIKFEYISLEERKISVYEN